MRVEEALRRKLKCLNAKRKEVWKERKLNQQKLRIVIFLRSRICMYILSYTSDVQNYH